MILLTGGAGFIGSAMLRKLNDLGHDKIIVVDNLGTSDKWKNLIGKRFTDYLHKDEFLRLLDNKAYFDDTTAVIHMGACSATTEQDADYLMRNNYHYSKRVARWALARNVRFIYASSAATYGGGELGFTDNDAQMPSLKPLNKYGYSKHIFDLWILQERLQSRVAGLKFFNVFGPNEYHKGDMRSLVNKAFYQVLESEKIRLFKSHRPDYADGAQVRDFVYIKDTVDIIAWLLEYRDVGGIFNLGTGKARSWNDLAKAVFHAMNKPVLIEYFDMPEMIRNAYQYHTEATMKKLQDASCPIRFRTLEESVKDYVQNYLSSNAYL
ncbi:ADP-glyceromanno-heptose 6-epimerase [bacterium]|nr:ADP-glyceromanno-heptose 6-epimerase [bacterium]NUN46246.1 ADP-glyceromanno-heptose 6-epimerase [bacterium]